jgi:hypothetical protein
MRHEAGEHTCPEHRARRARVGSADKSKGALTLRLTLDAAARHVMRLTRRLPASRQLMALQIQRRPRPRRPGHAPTGALDCSCECEGEQRV